MSTPKLLYIMKYLFTLHIILNGVDDVYIPFFIMYKSKRKNSSDSQMVNILPVTLIKLNNRVSKIIFIDVKQMLYRIDSFVK